MITILANEWKEIAELAVQVDAPTSNDAWTDGTNGEWSISETLKKPTTKSLQNVDEETLQRLAGLSSLEYERVREAEAEKLTCRVSVLDNLVIARRARACAPLQGNGINLADVEPWLESVNGAEVLSQIADSFSRYIALPEGAADALALWCAHAHCFSVFLCSPRLNISSPEKRCGKTTLRDVVGLFTPRALLAENLSTAVLFRVIEKHRPTLLADECDGWLRDNEELRSVLNAGQRRGGQALRCEGESNEVRAFNVFAPVVLCGIGALPGTLHDRSIVICLERAKPGELRERFDSRRVEREKELCRKLARFIGDNLATLETCEPKLPECAFNRLADNWRPLFTVAHAAGGDWPQRAAVAFAKLTAKADADAEGLGVMLLADVRQVFDEAGTDRIFSASLVEALNAMSERPWPEVRHGKLISETWVARRLKGFGVRSRKLRLPDEKPKQGYYLDDFKEAFERYLSPLGESKWNNGTKSKNTKENAEETVTF